MSRRLRPPAASAGFLPLAERPGRGADPLLVAEAAGLRHDRRVRRWRWGRFVVLAVALYSGWMGHREWVAYRGLHASAISLQGQAAALAAQHRALAQQIAYAQTSAYVAAAARQEFGFVSPNQVPLAPVPATGSGGTAPAATTATGSG